jgi:lipoate-protein ligase B
VEVRDLGVMEYGDCLQLQYHLRDEVQKGQDDVILVVEHPLVATLGRRGEECDVFDKSLPVFSIERGGKATLHGPGQLVVYPIIHLGEGNRDVRAWVRHLEALLIRMLGEFGISAETNPEYPGVWTTKTNKKIASIGIAVQKWVSFHGIAINVTLDPKVFEKLDPCGLGASVMTNMQIEGSTATMQDAKEWILAEAVNHFSAFRINDDNSHFMNNHYQ